MSNANIHTSGNFLSGVAVQSAVQEWWKRRHPPGRVVFNREHGDGK
jgi:hypothetical protein